MRKHVSQKVPAHPFFGRPPLFDQAPPFKENVPGPVPSAHPNFGQPPPLLKGGARNYVIPFHQLTNQPF